MDIKNEYNFKVKKYIYRYIELLLWSFLPYSVLLIITLINRDAIKYSDWIIITLILLFLIDFNFRRIKWISYKIMKLKIQDNELIIEFYKKDMFISAIILKENLKVEKTATLTRPPNIGINIYDNTAIVGSFYSDSIFSIEKTNQLYLDLKKYCGSKG